MPWWIRHAREFPRMLAGVHRGNRLLRNSAPGEAAEPFSHSYAYDEHGNMTSMPHLAAMAWDHADRLQHCDLGGGGEVWFVYDAGGARVRKVQRNASGSRVRERVYLGEFELYRERAANDVAPELARETLHVGDGARRLCLVETLTVADGEGVAAPVSVPRFQHGNHLDSAALELDGEAAVISYEEFHPFGSTSYAANDAAVEVSRKRYRYISKERDEETGLYHLGARYYAAWLGRWTAADPTGLADGVNRYAYCRGNPCSRRDVSGHATQPLADELRDSHIAAMHDALLTAMAGGNIESALEEVAATAVEATPAPRRKTEGEYQAAERRAATQRLDAEEAEHYNRPEIVEFFPFVGLVDLPHDAAQAGAAWEMGDEARFEHAATKTAIDVVSTTAEIMTLFASTSLRGGARLFAQGSSGAIRGGVKSAVAEARAAARESVAAAKAKARASHTEPTQRPERAAADTPAVDSAAPGGPVELRPYGGPGGGHHVPAKSAFVGAAGYDANLVLAIPNAELARFGVSHSAVTGAQMTGYRAFAQTGAPLSWDAVSAIETNALVRGGMPRDVAAKAVRDAIDALIDAGVTGPTRIPWGR